MDTAIGAGADYVGFVHVRKSPRYVSLDEMTELARRVPERVVKVVLTVDASEAELEGIAASGCADMFQLHGSESPETVRKLRNRLGLPIMKAIGIGSEEDVRNIAKFEDVADQILVDAKPAPGAEVPGGQGLPFEWRLVSRRTWKRPWMLAGGLHVGNVAMAASAAGATQVDVSSGVEIMRGRKDSVRIREFLRLVKEL